VKLRTPLTREGERRGGRNGGNDSELSTNEDITASSNNSNVKDPELAFVIGRYF